MNDDQELDQAQLEAATSRSLPAGVTLDAETSALRDGFIAWGRTVESTAADYDEALLLARLQASCADEGRPAVAAQSRRASDIWVVIAGGVLAASALIAVVRIASSWPAGDSVVVTRQAPHETNVATAPAVPRQHAKQPIVADDPGTHALAFDSIATWADPLDDEIAAAQTSLSGLSGDRPGIDGALSNIKGTLEALSDDLTNESL